MRRAASLVGVLLVTGSMIVPSTPAVADACPGDSTQGHRVQVIYAIPNDVEVQSRTSGIRSQIAFMDDALDYAAGPRHDQDIRWRCQNGNVQIRTVNLSLDWQTSTEGYRYVHYETLRQALLSAAPKETSNEKRLVYIES